MFLQDPHPRELTLGEWLSRTTPCPSCGEPNEPRRRLDEISGISKCRTCDACFRVDAIRGYDDWLRARIALVRAILARRAEAAALRLGVSGFRSAHL